MLKRILIITSLISLIMLGFVVLGFLSNPQTPVTNKADWIKDHTVLTTIISFIAVNFVGLTFLLIKYQAERTKSAAVFLKEPPAKQTTFVVEGDLTLGKLKEQLNAKGFKISYLDDETHSLVAEDSWSLSSWGFYYLIRLNQQLNGTEITIGTRGKFAQNQSWNPILISKHDEMCTIVRG